MINIEEGLTFDDVLLKPKYSEISTRSNVDLSVSLPKGCKLKIPIVSANMKHVTELKMADAIGAMGGLALLHRFQTPLEQLRMFELSYYKNNVGCSVGIKEEDKDSVSKFVDAGCKIICIDVAHAEHKTVGEFCAWLNKKYPSVLLIAGTIATREGAIYLSQLGVDVVRCGIGSGSICTTRINTGCGVPQLTALSESSIVQQWDKALIADGGITKPGDAVKALCFADLILCGNLFAGTDEAPGEKIIVDGKSYKQYAGSSTFKDKHVEGVSGLVPYKGSVKNVIEKILEGIRSGCSYQGVDNLKDLKKDPQFYRITNAGLKESHAHDIIVQE